MPPKAKVTKDMILHIALDITREAGFEAVNARSLADKLQCSTRPLFTCYQNMEELKADFLLFAYDYYEAYVEKFRTSAQVSPCLLFPLSYIEFAWEETHLFKLLFISDMDLNMKASKDFYNESGNEQKATLFSEAVGIPFERAKVIFLDLFLYTHGIAVLTATQKLALDRNSTQKMVISVLTAFVQQEKPGWNASV